MPIKYSLKLKMAVLLISIIALSITITSYIQFIESSNAIKNRVLNDLTALVNIKENQVVSIIDSYVDAMILNSSKRYPRGYIAKMKENSPESESLRKEAIKTLKDGKISTPAIKEMDVLDIEGRVVLSTEDENIGKNYSDNEIFINGKKSPYISDMYAENGITMIDIGVPTFNPYSEAKEIVGVFRTRLALNRLMEIMEDHTGMGETGEFVIGKRSGDKILYLSHPRHAYESSEDFFVPLEGVKAIAMKMATAGKKGIIKGIDYRGNLAFSSYLYISKLHCGIVAKIDEKEALLPIAKLLRHIIIAGLLLFFISSLMVVFFVRLLAGPLSELAKAIRFIGSGNLESRVKIKSSDEIGSLAEEFNKMAENLNKVTASRDELDAEIKKRAEAENDLKDALKRINDTQAQLIQSAKMAAVGQLASGVAHEINNPLTGVLNNVQLIKMKADMSPAFNMEDFKILLFEVESAALRCKRITQSLLELSHISQDYFKKISLNSLIEDTVLLIQTEMKLNNIQIVRDLKPVCNIKGDPQLLQQVILGLVANAKWSVERRYNKKEGLITISTQQNDVNKKVILSISDNGVGIPQYNISRLFEPFFTTKDPGEGTGLGLSLIHNIVKKHRGDIEVYSEVNVGATFKISIPCD